LREGARRSLDGYTFYLERRDEGRARLGILVSRKHAARAVERNRIKRCIREAFRLEQEALVQLMCWYGRPTALSRRPRRCDGCASSSAS